jgi:hypothetical protein
MNNSAMESLFLSSPRSADDHITVALAWAAQGLQPVEHGKVTPQGQSLLGETRSGLIVLIGETAKQINGRRPEGRTGRSSWSTMLWGCLSVAPTERLAGGIRRFRGLTCE